MTTTRKTRSNVSSRRVGPQRFRHVFHPGRSGLMQVRLAPGLAKTSVVCLASVFLKKILDTANPQPRHLPPDIPCCSSCESTDCRPSLRPLPLGYLVLPHPVFLAHPHPPHRSLSASSACAVSDPIKNSPAGVHASFIPRLFSQTPFTNPKDRRHRSPASSDYSLGCVPAYSRWPKRSRRALAPLALPWQSDLRGIGCASIPQVPQPPRPPAPSCAAWLFQPDSPDRGHQAWP